MTQVISTVRNMGVDDNCLTFISPMARSNWAAVECTPAPAASAHKRRLAAAAADLAPIPGQCFSCMAITSRSI
jgi:hypothetical protein